MMASKFSEGLCTWFLCFQQSVFCLYSSNITCREGLPPDFPIHNDILLKINETLTNSSRLLAFDKDMNKSMLCNVAEDIVSKNFGLNKAVIRTLPEQQHERGARLFRHAALLRLSLKSNMTTGTPLITTSTEKLQPSAYVNISSPASCGQTSNCSSDNTTMPSVPWPSVKKGMKTVTPKGQVIPERVVKPSAALIFAYTLQLLAENAFEERRRECIAMNGLYSDETGICARNRTDNTTAYTTHMKLLVDERASYLISVIGNSLSLLCLIMLIGIYTKFRSLQTRPGKNIMCLSAAMALAQALQLIGLHTVQMQSLCIALGIILHWAYLVAFIWMALISFDLFITFAFPFRSGKFGSKNQFFTYKCISVSIPTFIVLTCVIVEFSAHGEIGYGERICFVGGVWANLFSFVLPVAIVMVFNTICLIAAISRIYLSQEKSRELKSGDKCVIRDRLQLCLMALKVSTVTALGWIFGVLGGILGNTPLIYIFLLLTSSQGLLIFLAFCCNKRVLCIVKSMATDGTVTYSSKEKRTLLTTAQPRNTENGHFA